MHSDKNLQKILQEKFKPEQVHDGSSDLWIAIEQTLDKEKSILKSKNMRISKWALVILSTSLVIAFAWAKFSEKEEVVSANPIQISEVSPGQQKLISDTASLRDNTIDSKEVSQNVKFSSGLSNYNTEKSKANQESELNSNSTNLDIKTDVGYFESSSIGSSNLIQRRDRQKSVSYNLTESVETDSSLPLTETSQATDNKFNVITESFSEINLLPSIPITLLECEQMLLRVASTAFSLPPMKNQRNRNANRQQLSIRTEAILSDVHYSDLTSTPIGLTKSYNQMSSRTGRAFSINYSRPLKSNFIISVGLESLELRERFRQTVELGSSTTTMLVDTAYYSIMGAERQYQSGEREVQCDSFYRVEHTNKHKYVNVLSAIGYSFNLNEAQLLCSAEYGINLSYDYTGRLLSEDQRIINPSNMTELGLKRVKGIIGLRVMLDHPLGDHLSLGGHIALRKILGSSFNLLDVEAQFLSGGLSLNYNF